ncbi:recombinase family protein [Christensenella intestinihominis]|uniref:recombinase family protein n=1 Tax=Christensenella intestinihominis TaxID=1851429 RepID=UPI00082981B0|nr:recombinase family protein [Christensenella intestinihominis]
MNGVIYARYSSDNQREESIEGQIRECMEFAEKQDINILGTYIDRALSAKTDNRPDFQRMIKDSTKGLFDVAIVWRLDRFARNRYDSAHYKMILRKNGVKVVSARESIAEDSTGILLESVLEGYAEFFSAELSEKVRRGMKENALKCKSNGCSIPMGYVVDSERHFQIDPVAAPIVQEVFNQYAEGATMKEIADGLNAKGIRSSRGGPISLNIISHMLKNRRYLGEYRYGDIVTPGGMPVIISEELFERAQERMKQNKKAPARHKAEDDYLLTTKLYCGKCGAFMVGESGTSHTAKIYRYYKCTNTKQRKTCDKKAVQKDWIENFVVSRIMQELMHDDELERLIDALLNLQSKESRELPLLERQLAETENGIRNLLDAIQQGLLTESTKERLRELEETKSKLQTSILQEKIRHPLLTREQISFFIYRFRDSDITKREQRQRLIDSFVNAIYLYDDKVVITLNYTEGAKTISLRDIEGSDLLKEATPKVILYAKRTKWLFCMFGGFGPPGVQASASRGRRARYPFWHTTSRQVPRFQSPRICEGFFMLHCRSFPHATRYAGLARGPFLPASILYAKVRNGFFVCSGNSDPRAGVQASASRRRRARYPFWHTASEPTPHFFRTISFRNFPICRKQRGVRASVNHKPLSRPA